ncbi:hypothetical protein [Alkalitalea saponilacus]|uniref:Uncharacterized protein n=1 Tax=Alkalitalea saponilacus TaxID=889453 RepID=A0A1T5H4J1_9BACT|nr:hypothetical protein [Alkalitalea saponilacus]ASB50891.1 hypothetical protein CDL62_17915 [Alkalitalea saponilacus]SKC15597.1 hypothetical protein SAMN03080601_02081 [Alkalitalea saponilacus]
MSNIKYLILTMFALVLFAACSKEDDVNTIQPEMEDEITISVDVVMDGGKRGVIVEYGWP